MKQDHKFITLERIVTRGITNFGRNIWLAIAAIAMMGITLTILLFAVIANATFSHTINDFTHRINVSVYLKDSISTSQTDQLISQLKKVDNVESVKYTNKAEALKNYRAQYANNKTLLTAISETDNPLPATIIVQPKDPNRLQSIKDFLDRKDIAALQSDPTSYSGDLKKAIDNITQATHFFRQAGVIGIVVFIFISMLIIFNTIRMAIFNRRDELIIMRLLGAGPWYIKGPFVVETMLYGIVAAIISLVFCSALFSIAGSTLHANSLGLLDVTYANDYFKHHLLMIVLVQIGAGIIIGAASSLVATRRYLKLK